MTHEEKKVLNLLVSKKITSLRPSGKDLYGDYYEVTFNNRLTVTINLKSVAEELLQQKRLTTKTGDLDSRKEYTLYNYLRYLGVKNWYCDKRKNGTWRIKIEGMSSKAEKRLIEIFNECIDYTDCSVKAEIELLPIWNSRGELTGETTTRVILRTSMSPAQIIIS